MTFANKATRFRPNWRSRLAKNQRIALPTARACESRRTVSLLAASATAALIAMSCYGGSAHASKLQLLTSFQKMKGAAPRGALLADSAGNVYGTASGGGKNRDGAVFQLSPWADKKEWRDTALFSFNGTNGNAPWATLIADGAGDLYGTTSGGGAENSGVVFELSPPKAGEKHWKEMVLHSFDGFYNGSNPYAGVIADSAGNLYGTTRAGGYVAGGLGYGLVYELSPPTHGQTAWTETVLHTFNSGDGAYPGDLLADGAGNLYGTTYSGGGDSKGMAFELSPPAPGQTEWTETVLYSFHTYDGANPNGGLIADGAGNLYGVSFLGGANLEGSVYELSPPTRGQTAWSVKVLYSFPGGTGGQALWGKLLADGKNHLYGTTAGGGAHDAGLVFELSRENEAWTEKTLYSFNGAKGSTPFAGLIADSEGNLYGTAAFAGAHDDGTVFKLTH